MPVSFKTNIDEVLFVINKQTNKHKHTRKTSNFCVFSPSLSPKILFFLLLFLLPQFLFLILPVFTLQNNQKVFVFLYFFYMFEFIFEAPGRICIKKVKRERNMKEKCNWLRMYLSIINIHLCSGFWGEYVLLNAVYSTINNSCHCDRTNFRCLCVRLWFRMRERERRSKTLEEEKNKRGVYLCWGCVEGRRKKKKKMPFIRNSMHITNLYWN